MGNNSNTTFIPQTPYIECQKFVLFCVFLCCLCFTGVRICKNWSSLSDTSMGRFDNRTGVTDQCCALSASNFYLKGAQNNTPLVFMSHKAKNKCQKRSQEFKLFYESTRTMSHIQTGTFGKMEWFSFFYTQTVTPKIMQQYYVVNVSHCFSSQIPWGPLNLSDRT